MLPDNSQTVAAIAGEERPAAKGEEGTPSPKGGKPSTLRHAPVPLGGVS